MRKIEMPNSQEVVEFLEDVSLFLNHNTPIHAGALRPQNVETFVDGVNRILANLKVEQAEQTIIRSNIYPD